MFSLHHVQLAIPAGGDLFPGFQRVYDEDCFGNRLEFVQPD